MVRNQSNKDYYGILGVSVSATEPEIRRAYRKLALQWHPDRNPDNPEATERFKEISEAYGVLTDASKRMQYDLSRKSGTTDAFQYTQDDILRDLFRSPEASAMFEELAREFERMGMRVDRQYFDHVLFGGRTHISGGIFIVSPFRPVSSLFRLIGGAIRNSINTNKPDSKALRGPSKLFAGIAKFSKWLLGDGVSGKEVDSADVAQSLQITAAEALHGISRKVVIQTNGSPEQVLLTIPAGIKSGTKLRLKGKGRGVRDGNRGDLYLTISIV